MTAETASPRHGYRGYITPRPVRASRTPQHVQNLVIRDYAARNGLMFKLSATEYVMPGCYMMLQSVLDELPSLEGIIGFSLFMLPQRRERRLAVYERVLAAGCTLHMAVEGLVLADAGDIRRFEDILGVEQALARTPAPAGSPGAFGAMQ